MGMWRLIHRMKSEGKEKGRTNEENQWWERLNEVRMLKKSVSPKNKGEKEEENKKKKKKKVIRRKYEEGSGNRPQ